MKLIVPLLVEYWMQLRNLSYHVRHRAGYPRPNCGCPGCVSAINRMYAE